MSVYYRSSAQIPKAERQPPGVERPPAGHRALSQH